MFVADPTGAVFFCDRCIDQAKGVVDEKLGRRAEPVGNVVGSGVADDVGNDVTAKARELAKAGLSLREIGAGLAKAGFVTRKGTPHDIRDLGSVVCNNVCNNVTAVRGSDCGAGQSSLISHDPPSADSQSISKRACRPSYLEHPKPCNTDSIRRTGTFP